MNAFTPKASVLIRLAQHLNELREHGHSYMSIFADSEVLEWYARMAELEYVPMLPAMLAGFQDGVAHATEIQARLSGTNLEGQPVSETLTLRPC